MTQIILKSEINQSKLDILLSLLDSWGLDAEVKNSTFPLTFGLWEGREIDAKELRREAWGIDKRLGLTGNDSL
jgi:hypothetical protein